MLKSFFIANFLLHFIAVSFAQQPVTPKGPVGESPSPIVDFDGYIALAAEVQIYRKNRLVNLDRFLELAKQPNTIILDTRSQQFFALKHLKGAKNLTFSDFTMGSLAQIIPNSETTILIYCNNNFMGDAIAFRSKTFDPLNSPIYDGMNNKKPISLALNIPTFINLYGYGYRNIYELESIIVVTDPRLEFEGKAVKSAKKKRK